AHTRDEGTHQQDRGDHIRLDGSKKRVVIPVGKLARGRAGVVIDENIDVARLRDQFAAPFFRGEIRGYLANIGAGIAKRIGRSGQFRRIAAIQNYAASLARQRLGARMTETLGRSANQRGTPLESEVHIYAPVRVS